MTDAAARVTGLDRRWLVVAGAFLGIMAFSSSRHMYPFVLPSMAAGLQLSNERMGNISSAYFVAYLVSSFTWGVLADRLGSRRLMLLGMSVIALGLVAMGTADAFVFALAFNLLCGAGAAALSVPQVPLLSRWFPDSGRGLAIGLAMTGNGFATFTFGRTIPLVIEAGDWRWAWWATAGLVAVASVGAFFLLRETPPRPAPGVVVRRPIEASGGVARPSRRPSSVGDALRQPAAWNLIIAYSVWGLGYTIFKDFAVAYLREQRWDTAAASQAFGFWGLFTMLGAPVWGALADRMAKKWVLSISIILQVAGYLSFLYAGPAGVPIGAAAVGFGQIGVPAVMSAATRDYFPSRITGMAFGLLTLAFSLGCILGPSLGGMISDATGTLGHGLLFGLGALCVSLVATMILARPPAAEEEPSVPATGNAVLARLERNEKDPSMG